MVTGMATVIDGDTIEVGARMIDLFGVDAPEAGQTFTVMLFPWKCGREATKMLTALGFRRFSLRGLAKVRGEWDLVCLALNIKRMGTVATC